MIVVSDASPLNYLVLVEAIDILLQVFGRVLAPPHVMAELLHKQAPATVSHWASSPPHWLEIHVPQYIDDTSGFIAVRPKR